MSSPVEMRDVAPWVERLARVGYAAKALLYITIGILAASAAFGQGGRATDTQGAMSQVGHMAYGRLVLYVVAVGLLGYALWRLVEAWQDPDNRGTDAKGLALRASFAFRGVFHGALGLAAFRLASRAGSGQGQNKARHWTGVLLGMPAGELLVWLAAASVAGYGAYQLYRSYAAKLGSQLDLSSVSPQTRAWVVGVSRFGIAARGVVFLMIGFFLSRAATRHDADEVGGVRESLAMLAGIGHWPFALVSLGLIAYGVYELVNARYRRIRVR